ncbi:probable dihydroxyacetone kinase regulator [uncultured Roseburia sp.]|uniref:TetR family transcriptional regulator C-terminal domain-containing protein n=1 Tax=Brotonthovivens ammoniilytica TaxID=2981725 RepID=A0ABT2TKN9_9FIRM|nr:TetR-like C-terminal domain-containing protein [Brotonthovivens ammoniilytica]MCU6762726.1 TetR family transcriptional regulator C-terminal domain-containing protein [Brotonthovivens ammoniilytica]SCI86225.1 probable dihydroxyacetone kinase regulator [uncultured Roseburia sp.]
MEQKIDRRIRKTKSQLRNGLAALMQTKSINEITVKELVDAVDINRSTFYLHYTDIYDLLQKTEDDLLEQVKDIIREHAKTDDTAEATFPFMEDIFETVDANREIFQALVGSNGDISFIHKVEDIIAQNTIYRLEKMFPDNVQDLKYYYSFCLTGAVGLIKTWITENSRKSPEHMARLAYQMVTNAMQSFFENAAPLVK